MVHLHAGESTNDIHGVVDLLQGLDDKIPVNKEHQGELQTPDQDQIGEDLVVSHLPLHYLYGG